MKTSNQPQSATVKPNFHGYLISWFYATRKNQMHAKISVLQYLLKSFQLSINKMLLNDVKKWSVSHALS